jgi:predicted PurR-regulated permease PerM
MASVAESPRERWVAPVALILLTAALCASVGREGLVGRSPFVWYGLVTYVALRHRDQRWVPTVFVPATAVFVLWFARAAASLTFPFLCGLLLAYLLDPLVDRAERRLGRKRAIALVAGPLALLLAGVLALALPALAREMGALAQRLPDLLEVLRRAAAWALERAEAFGVRVDRDTVMHALAGRVQQLATALGGAGLTLLRGAQGILGLVSFLVVTPVIGFYLLRDADRLRAQAIAVLPDSRRVSADTMLRNVDRAVSAYLRGQLLVGAVDGLLLFVGLTVLGVDYALLVGLCCIGFNLVPYVGGVLTGALAVAVALLADPSWASVIKAGALFAVVQLLDSTVISPRIIGGSLSLHPLAVMFAVLVGGQFFGLAGVALAVPVVAVLKEAIVSWAPEVLRLLPQLDREGPRA